MADERASVPAPEEPRRLRRSRDDKVFAGVCGGLGRYLGIDPVLIRILFVGLAPFGGSGVVLYIVGWILIPEESPGESVGEIRPSAAATLPLIFGGALIAVGVVALLGVSFPQLWKYFWPLALIVVGVAIIIQTSSRR